MGKSNKKGRSDQERWVGLPHSVFYSASYRAMSGNGRSLLWEMIGRYNGYNNGELSLSVRDAQRMLGLGSDAAVTRAFKEIEAHGFAVTVEKGAFGRKVRHATTWRLTFRPSREESATHDYLRWKPAVGSKQAKRLQVLSDSNLRSEFAGLSVLLKKADRASTHHQSVSGVPQSGTANMQGPQDCVVPTAPKFGAHIICHTVAKPRRAALDDCKRIRDRALLCLRSDPDRTQRQLAALAGLSESKLSRFLHDRSSRRTLDMDDRDRLARAISRMTMLKPDRKAG